MAGGCRLGKPSLPWGLAQRPQWQVLGALPALCLHPAACPDLRGGALESFPDLIMAGLCSAE